MSLVYCFRCDGCGEVSYHLPEGWTQRFGGTRHYCNDDECRYESGRAAERKYRAEATNRAASSEERL